MRGGTMVVFRESAEAMARDYHVYLVIADVAVILPNL